jgi:iron complex transport system substrate-binding protein
MRHTAFITGMSHTYINNKTQGKFQRGNWKDFVFYAFTLVICLLSSALFAAPSRAIEITDDLGRKITLDQPAKRIIPLYGAFSEMLFAAGAGEQVIARTQADNFPPELARLPSVGTHMRPNFEMIMGLKPDLVIQSATRNEEAPEISRLIDSGIPVAVFAPRSFQDIFSVIERLGVLSGHAESASTFVSSLNHRLEAIKDKLKDIETRQKVFFEIRAEPITGAGRGSIVYEILKAAGAENVLENDKAIVQYNLEALLFESPDAYVVQQGPMNKNPMDPRKRAHFERLKCVREGRIIFADEFIYSRPGPRCVDAVEQLAAALYPERFRK